MDVNPQLAWYVARSTGIVAWAVLTASVVWGLLLSTRLARGRPTPAWLTDLHRFLGGAALVFTGLHLAGLVADTYVQFGVADLLVPLASGWRPWSVAVGIVAFYLLVAVEVTSLLMRRLPRRWWRRVHLGSYLLFWLATFHFLLAGTDAGNPLAVAGIDLVVALVVFLSLVRVLSPKPDRSAARSRTNRSVTRPRPERTTTPSRPDPTQVMPRLERAPAPSPTDETQVMARPEPTAAPSR